MTDATTGAGAEGTPRDGKQRDRSAVPATPPGHAPATPGHAPATPGHDPATGEPASAPRGDTVPGSMETAGRGLAERPGGIPGESEPGGETAAGRDATRGPLGATTPHRPTSHLLPHDESDKLSLRLQHAVTEFVDGPRAAVEEADHVLEEAASRLTEAVTERRRTLRRSWQATDGDEGKSATSADTEQLRLALRDYRELTERLLRL
jgi:hypothetical protein